MLSRKDSILSLSRNTRSTNLEDSLGIASTDDFRPAVITGLRVEAAEKGITYDEDGASVVLAGTPVRYSPVYGIGILLYIYIYYCLSRFLPSQKRDMIYYQVS